MQPVFRLLKYQRPWRVDHVVGDFIAAMRRQAVQEDGIAFGLAEQSRIDLIRKENMLSLLRSDRGESITSLVTSSPRCAGRQCKKMASRLAWRNRVASP